MNQAKPDGQPLCAAMRGDEAMLQFFLGQSLMDVQSGDGNGDTAHWACFGGLGAFRPYVGSRPHVEGQAINVDGADPLGSSSVETNG